MRGCDKLHMSLICDCVFEPDLFLKLATVVESHRNLSNLSFTQLNFLCSQLKFTQNCVQLIESQELKTTLVLLRMKLKIIRFLKAN